jgi:hypothetical protein
MKKWVFLLLLILFVFSIEKTKGQNNNEKGTYSFGKKKRSIALKNLNIFKRKSITSAHVQKGKNKKGTYSFNKRKRRVKRSNGFFAHNKRRSFIGPGISRGKSSSNFSKKRYGKKNILSFIPNGRRNKKFHNSGLRNNSTSHYNRKLRRITPNDSKRFLFFKKKRHEKYTDTFKGGHLKKFLNFNKYSSKKRKSVHPRGLFRSKARNPKKRKLEMNLFAPRVRTH